MSNQDNSESFQFFSTGKIVGVLVVLALAGVYLRYRVNANRIRQEERAVNRIARIFRMQEDHFTRFAQPFNVDAKVEFAESLEELEESYSPSDEYYEYQMIQESPQAVIVTATAKQRGLKSFTAALFVKSGSFNRRMCETKKFVMTSPKINSAYELENSCPPESELYTDRYFDIENLETYEATSIGNAGCRESGAFNLGSKNSRKGHFKEFVDTYVKYGLLENDTFLLRVKELRDIRYSCRQTVCNRSWECARAGFNISFPNPINPNSTIDFAVVSYVPPSGNRARPSNAPDLYVFHSPQNSRMRIVGQQGQTTITFPKRSLSSKIQDFFQVLMR